MFRKKFQFLHYNKHLGYGCATVRLLDEQGQTFEITYNEGTVGAKWQFQAGDIMDDIQPGLTLGIVMPSDMQENLGDVWLKVEQDPNFVMYLGNASEIPLE